MKDAEGTTTIDGKVVPWRTHFCHDLIRIYTEELARRGFVPRNDVDVYELAFLLQDWRRRRLEDLEGRPATVSQSRELAQIPPHPAVLQVIQLAEQGKPLWPYTSKQTSKPSKHDALLNHWGIYHLHLGGQVEADGYIQRTGELLFARVVDTQVYLIGIYDHESFRDSEVLQTAIRNWPDSFEPHRLRGLSVSGSPYPAKFIADGKLKSRSRTVLVHPTQDSSAESVGNFRKLGVNPTFQAESGALYSPTGGGLTCAGTSALAMVHADHEIWWAQQLCNRIQQHLDQLIAGLLQRQPPACFDALSFRLESLEALKAGAVLEETSRTRLQLPWRFDDKFNAPALLRSLSAAALANSPYVSFKPDE